MRTATASTCCSRSAYPKSSLHPTADTAAAAQADRDGKHMLFAERYEGSELCCRNALLLAQTQERDLSAPSPEVQAELAIKRETANPMYWGVWTLLRVRPMLGVCRAHQTCPGPWQG